MGLKIENVAQMALVCLLLSLSPFVSFAQSSACKVRVAGEPISTSMSREATKVSQSNSTTYKSWLELDAATFEDNKSGFVEFTTNGFSQIVKFSNFNFNVPLGATVENIIVTFKGRREGTGYVKDERVVLSANSLSSDNLGGKGYNAANVFAKSSSDKKWRYGFNDKTWGVNWTASQINDPSFGVELQLLNITPKEVKAFIDNVKIDVQYTPLATFCFTDCFPVYTDPVPGAVSYFWHIPQGFDLISKSERSNIVDFKVMNAQSKVYNICVDAIDAAGKVKETCCRDLRIRSCVPSKLGDFVWNDFNGNGLQDQGEPGIAGLKVSLFTSNNVLVKTVTTTANGSYTFDNLAENSYYIKVDIPNDYLPTIKLNGNSNLNSDFSAGNVSTIINLQYGEDVKDFDFGLIKKLEIGDFVWEDINYNGIQDVGENGIGDVDVFLYDQNNIQVAKTKTFATGAYSFMNIPARKYKLRFNPTEAYFSTKKNQGINFNIDSDIDGDSTTLISFENTSINNSIDAGYIKYGSVGDFVWNDVDFDGIQDTGEDGTSGLHIYLKNDAGTVIDSTISVNGNYSFGNLFPGKYSVEITLPKGTSPTKFSNSVNGSVLKQIGLNYTTDLFEVFSGSNLTNVDLGYAFLNGKLCGQVWKDVNADGQYTADEALVEAVSVSLIDKNLNVIKSTLTDLNGAYCFDSLQSNDYKVLFNIDADLQYTQSNIGSDLSDSDVLLDGFGSTDFIILLPGDSIFNIDAGILRRSVIGDFVWNDTNYNGLQDANEEGIPDVKLLLYDKSNNLIAQTTSSITGEYLFQNIVAGTYYIKIDLPQTYLVSKSNGVDQDLNNDFLTSLSTNNFDVLLGIDKTDIDAGLVKSLELGDFVWEDTNYNGFQDLGEKGIADVVVYLYDENNTLIDSTITIFGGGYKFKGVPATVYKIVFKTNAEFLPTKRDLVNTNFNSDVDANGSTDFIDFENTNQEFTIDAGFIRYASVGDFVWYDSNANGLQDSDEPGTSDLKIYLKDDTNVIIDSTITIDGVYSFKNVFPGKYSVEILLPNGTKPTQYSTTTNGSVLKKIGSKFETDVFELKSGDALKNLDLGYDFLDGKICGQVWNDADADGQYNIDEELVSNILVSVIDKNGTVLKSTFTDSNGAYCFDSLKRDQYSVVFDITDDLLYTNPNVGDDNSDSDVISEFGQGITDAIILTAGDSISHIDAGILRRSIIGDFVWNDINGNGLQDIDEPGLEGVQIALLDKAGNIIDETFSSTNGAYLFQNVVAGAYRIKLILPSGYLTSKVGLDSTMNNDVSALLFSNQFEVKIGGDRTDLDVGLIKSLEIGDLVWEDKNGNGIRDAEDVGIADVLITIYDEFGNPASTTISDENGFYFLNNVPALSYKVKFIIQDYQATLKNIGDPMFDSDINENLETDLINFSDKTKDFTIDAGLYKSSCIGDYIWLDKNEDGLQSTDDLPLKDVLVQLIDFNNVTPTNFVTDSTGKYIFDNLKPGKYVIKVKPSSSYIPTVKGTDSTIDDVNGMYISDTIVVSSGSSFKNYDAGFLYRPLSKICGLTWNDLNGDGVQDATEPIFPNVAMCLTDSLGNKIRKLKSNSDGLYCTNDIKPGKYKIRYYISDNYQFTFNDIGNDDNIDSDALGIIDSATTDIIILKEGEDQGNINAGITTRSTLGDFVWLDINRDGVQFLNEIGIPNLPISLCDENKVPIAVTTSNEFGKYEFTKVPRGNYYIKFPTNPMFDFTLKDMTSDKGSDVNPDGSTDLIAVIQNIDNNSIDAGYVPKGAAIGGIVWQDLDKDTTRTIQDILLPNVVVSLYDTLDNLTNITTTNEKGEYSFFPVPEGYYYVKFDTALFQTFVFNDGTNIYSDVDNSNGRGTTSTIFVPLGSLNAGIDAGMINTISSIAGQTWFDENGNGILDKEETASQVVKVFLIKDSTVVDSTLTSLQDGTYKFDSLTAGIYLVKFDTINKNYLFTNKVSAVDTITVSSVDMMGLSDTIDLKICSNIKNINAGYNGFGNIIGEAFIDVNENGLNDDTIDGLNNVALCLVDVNGNIVARDTTSLLGLKNGQFAFNNIPAGMYKLKVRRPLYYVFTEKNVNANSNDQNDNDFSLVGSFDAYSDLFLLKSNGIVDSIDFGLIYRIPMESSISGFAWDELIVDGTRQSDELYRDAQIFILYDDADKEISRDTTDASGYYLFDNLTEGYYYVKALIDDVKTTTYINKGNDGSDDNDFTDAYQEDATSLFYLGISQDTVHVDLGVTDEVQIGDYVWEDLNFNGLQDADEPGLSGVEIKVIDLFGNIIKTTTSDVNGKYFFKNIPIGLFDVSFKKLAGYSATLQNTGDGTNDSDVGEDCNTGLRSFSAGMHLEMDAGLVKNGIIGDRVWVDFNADGIQDIGEPGKDSVVVKLLKPNGTLVATTKTFTELGQPGKYSFKNVSPGNYCIHVVIPTPFKATIVGAADEDLNSDIDEVGKTATFTLLPSENKNNIDGGLYLPACLGNRVWFDENKNGIQDADENGVPNITVELYQSNGTLVNVAATDINGSYIFQDLTQGLYYAVFKAPSDRKFTDVDQGDETNDSDASQNGTTPLISLAHGAKYYDLDAGLIPATALLLNHYENNNAIVKAPHNIVSPNPALNIIQIHIPYESATVQIIDKHGKVVEQFTQNQKYEYKNVSNYPADVYFIRVIGEGKSMQTKFIKVD